MCFELCRSSSTTPQTENKSCLQKFLTKEALFVIGCLLGGGAVLSYFSRLGGYTTAGFGLVGSVCLVSSFISRVKSKPAHAEDNSRNNGSSMAGGVSTQSSASSASSAPTLLKDDELLKTEVSCMSDQELVRSLVPKKNPAAVQSTNHQESPLDKKNKQIHTQLSVRVGELVSSSAPGGAQKVSVALEPLFSVAGEDLEKFRSLVNMVFLQCNFTAGSLVAALEAFCNNDKKVEVMSEVLAKSLISKKQIDSFEDEIHIPGSPDKMFYTTEIRVKTGRIFGQHDFTRSTLKPLSPILVNGIGKAIREIANDWQAELQETYDADSVDPSTSIGVRVVIPEFKDCRFPASMIAPLLPFLKNVPGMIGLEISGIEDQPSRSISHRPTRDNNGFRDEDADVLLEIIKTNPNLAHVKIRSSGMSQERQSSFLKECQEIIQTRNLIPSAQQILAVP